MVGAGTPIRWVGRRADLPPSFPPSRYPLNNATLASWNTISDPCGGWSKVACDGNGSVVQLNLNGSLGLRGTLPTEIGLLSSMTTAFLAANSLSGSIPSSMGNLTQLTALGGKCAAQEIGRAHV